MAWPHLDDYQRAAWAAYPGGPFSPLRLAPCPQCGGPAEPLVGRAYTVCPDQGPGLVTVGPDGRLVCWDAGCPQNDQFQRKAG